MSGLLPARARRRPPARASPAQRAGPARRQHRAHARWRPLPRVAPRRRRARDLARRVSVGRWTAETAVADDALDLSGATWAAMPSPISCRPGRIARRCCGCWCRGRGSTPACRRCTTAACSRASCRRFGEITQPRRARLLPQYTVDEHTLQTVRNLERLTADDHPRERFATVLRELESPELLVLALLLHDMGKRCEEDHANESVRWRRPARRSAARRRRAGDRHLPDPSSSAHVAGGVPARHGGPRDRPRLRARLSGRKRA